MVCTGSEPIGELRVGEMGVQEARLGGDSLLARTGGYFYLELTTKE